MINLRPYQLEAIESIKQRFKGLERQYVEMPTGSGKTVTFLSYASQNHKRILIVVPSKELLKQIFETALLFYHKSEISRKGDKHDEPVGKIHICIINSLRGDYLEHINDQYFDLIIIDEAHHSHAASYKKVIEGSAFAPKILGVTATPDRADGQVLSKILHSCSFKLEIESLITEGWLSDIEGFSVKTNIDISNVDDHNGDFSINQLYKKLCKDDRNKMIIDLCKKHMTDRKNLVFCINIDHSKKISNLLNDSGVSAMHIDGSMKETERHSILTAFREGHISTLCNCQLLTEGFDEPSIDGIILARPTRSRALFTQMIGRGLRLSPGKTNCKIIDIVDNHKNLSGFNNLLIDVKYPEMNSFKSIKEIRDHIGKEMIKVTEFTIERSDLLKFHRVDDIFATDSMHDYLDNNQIKYFEPLSFNEGSFLIWFNELKKEYANG